MGGFSFCLFIQSVVYFSQTTRRTTVTEDNVLRPVFGKKKLESAIQPALPQSAEEKASDDYKYIGPITGEALEQAQKDLLYIYVNGAFVERMRNKIQEAGDTIFGLKDFVPDQASIRLRRQGLKSFSLEQICQEIERTHELQWRSQPSYLGALTLEHHYRVQTALSLMNET